jgi:type IV pilus assembly protein PilV
MSALKGGKYIKSALRGNSALTICCCFCALQEIQQKLTQTSDALHWFARCSLGKIMTGFSFREHILSFVQIRAPAAFKGFSLLEVLVASTVFSLGLAGITALLLTNIIASSEARHEGIAMVAATNLAEYIHLNPYAIDSFTNPTDNISHLCMADSLCTPVQQADYDFKLWRIELADSLYNGLGIVCRDTTPQDGGIDNSECDGGGPLVIKIFWSGRTSSDKTDNGQSPRQYRVSLELG